MTARLDEPDQVGRAIVVVAALVSGWYFRRSKVEQRSIEQRLDLSSGIVDESERRHAARRNAENLFEQLRPAERQARAAQSLRQRFRSIRRWFETDQQSEPTLLSLRDRFLQWPPGM